MSTFGIRSGTWLPYERLSMRQAAIAATVGLPLLCAVYAALIRRRRRQQPPTSFAAFLKQPADVGASGGGALAATDFGSFLKQRGPAAAAAGGPAAAQPDEQSGPPLTGDSVVVTILFGTEYGFSKEIAEKLAAALCDSPPYWPRVVDMADHPQGLDLSREQALLVVCSTQGDGVPPAEAREFCDWLCASASLAEGVLQGNSFSVCALGDRSYEHFCACGKMLDARLEALGGKRFVPRTDVNREDWGAVDAWLAGVTAALKALPLRPAAETGHSAAEAAGADAAAAPRWGKSRPYPGRVVAIEGLCNITRADDKDTVRVELDLGDSGISYMPGDALGICPSNRPQDVDQLLAAMGASGEEPVQRPTWPFREAADGSGGGADGGTLPLRTALTSCYDIRAPKPELLQALLKALPAPATLQNGKAAGHQSHAANGLANGHAHGQENAFQSGLQNGRSHSVQNGKLESAANGKLSPRQGLTAAEQAALLQGIMRADIEAYLAPRHVADVLADFPEARLPVSEVASVLRQLQPRLYSISSSQAEATDRVQGTVAVVRYDALGKDRVGVTSTLLAERLQVGDTLPVYVSRNPDFRLPESPSTPIIMVGPGTGLAPFRAFMQERVLRYGDGPAAVATSSQPTSDTAALPSPWEQAGSAAQAPRSFLPSSASSSSLADSSSLDGGSGGADAAAGNSAASTGSAGRAHPAAAGSSPSADAAAPPASGDAAAAGAAEGSAQQRLGPAMLFFGCRRPDQDFLYGELLQGWADAGLLELHTAFSRQQAGKKVYVQDRLRQAGARVWELLQGGAHFFVCGDAGSMAPAVQEALLDIIAHHQGGGRGAAEAYLARLGAKGRYQRDVWLV